MKERIKDLIKCAAGALSNPLAACGAIFLISALSLMAALTAQYVYGLEPCVLCIYQRWPYAAAGTLGVIGMIALYRPEGVKFAAGCTFVSGIVFLIGGVIAFYHVGVEQHWWVSVLEGCAADFETGGSVEELKALFDSKPAVRCDQIPWADPFFGISMAGYNAMMSFGLAALSCLSAIMIVRKANGML